MRSKYHNKKVVWRGEKFDSIKERDRYSELLLLQRARKITGLSRQVKFQLIPTQYTNDGKLLFRATHYIADFVYWQDGKYVVEDVKGYKKGQAYQEFLIKKKLMYMTYGHIVKET